MKELIYFEKRKLLRRRAGSIVTLIMLLSILALSLVFISDQGYFAPDGTELSGLAAIAAKRETEHALAGPLTNEKTAEILSRYQEIYADAANLTGAGFIKDEIYLKEVLPYREILNLIRSVYMPSRDLSALTEISREQAGRFYETRRANIAATVQDFSTAEKETVSALSSQVEEPFIYDYTNGWRTLLVRAFQSVFLLISLSVCIIISPVFAGEYQSGADALILSSRYGRREIVRAKITAGFLVANRIYFSAVSASLVSVLAAFGVYGWDCNFQLISVNSFYALKIWQVLLFGLIINYAVVLSVTAFTMLLSAACKTPFAAVVISTLCTFVPLFIPLKDGSLLTYLVNLLPARAMEVYYNFSSYELYSLGSLVIPLPLMIFICACAVIAAALPAARRVFCRHQVL